MEAFFHLITNRHDAIYLRDEFCQWWWWWAYFEHGVPWEGTRRDWWPSQSQYPNPARHSQSNAHQRSDNLIGHKMSPWNNQEFWRHNGTVTLLIKYLKISLSVKWVSQNSEELSKCVDWKGSNRTVSNLVVTIDLCKANFGGVLERSIGLPEALESPHWRPPLPLPAFFPVLSTSVTMAMHLYSRKHCLCPLRCFSWDMK